MAGHAVKINGAYGARTRNLCRDRTPDNRVLSHFNCNSSDNRSFLERDFDTITEDSGCVSDGATRRPMLGFRASRNALRRFVSINCQESDYTLKP
jgi:hypothetical protein